MSKAKKIQRLKMQAEQQNNEALNSQQNNNPTQITSPIQQPQVSVENRPVNNGFQMPKEQPQVHRIEL